MKQKFIITIKADNTPGLVSQITNMINRKRLEMESLSAAKTDISTVVMVTVELLISENEIHLLITKLENIIEVYAVDAVKSDNALTHRVAYFKLSKEIYTSKQCAVLRKSGVQIVNFYSDAILVTKSGSDSEIRSLYNELEGTYLLGFIQSGQIAYTSLIDNDEVRVINSILCIEAVQYLNNGNQIFWFAA